MSPLKSPFPWFGGKSKVAPLVWERFGDVPNYCEPFFGSGAVLLARPHDPGIETINDLDCFVANFWRALEHDPDEVALHADWPVNEADQHVRHLWLCSQADFRERMKTDPDYYDAKIAGWWIWGQCIWIGSGWCARELPGRQIPHLGDAGKGINRQRPHLGNAGTGIHRKLPHLGDAGKGINRTSQSEFLLEYMQDLSARLRRVRVCCGDWSRILGPSPTTKLGVTGVFLDPPYGEEANRAEVYATDSTSVAADVRKWAIENGSNPDLRIALCGYEGEHEMPGWECVAWKASGGYGSQGEGAGRDNAERERIWFSPFCLKPEQEVSLFNFLGAA